MVYRWPIIFALFLTACTATSITDQSPQTGSSPENAVRQFYDWYLHGRFPNPDKEHNAKFRKYVTRKFLKEAAGEWDAVLFIAAQDADPTWANDFSVAIAKINCEEVISKLAYNGKKIHATLNSFI